MLKDFMVQARSPSSLFVSSWPLPADGLAGVVAHLSVAEWDVGESITEVVSPARAAQRRWVALWLGLAVLLAAMALDPARTGWNVNSRLALVLAIVDEGTFRIDTYHDTEILYTEDKAVFQGHYYSDKVIGVSMLAVPAYAALRVFAPEPSVRAANYVLRVWAVSLPAAVAASFLWLLLLRLGAEERRALWLLATALMGSIFFGYSTVFFPYAPGIACCVVALWLAVGRDGAQWGQAPTWRASGAIGGLLGYALICDFLFGIVVLGVVALYFARLARARPPWLTAATTTMAAVMAGAVPLAGFAIYSTVIFGAPTIPYVYLENERFRLGMSQGLMGIGVPRLDGLWLVTLHPFRGVLFWCPLLAAMIAGGAMEAWRGATVPRRVVGALVVAVASGYIVANSGYYMWWTGWGMGTRLPIPMWAVVPLGLAAWCRPSTPRWMWMSALALGAVGVAMNLPLSIIDAQVPQGNADGLLAGATWGTPIAVPQFTYLRAFYSGAYFLNADSSLDVERVARAVACVALAAGCLAAGDWTARQSVTNASSD